MTSPEQRRKTQELRREPLEALARAFARLPEVWAACYQARDREEATQAVMALLSVTETQARHILTLPLDRSNRQARQHLLDELATVRADLEQS